MILAQAIAVRDRLRETHIGKPFDNSQDGWLIKDVIVSNYKHVGSVYTIMWENDLTNEQALHSIQISDDDYDVFIISHQWPWGSGDLLFQKIKST
jgi:hypothetical protein